MDRRLMQGYMRFNWLETFVIVTFAISNRQVKWQIMWISRSYCYRAANIPVHGQWLTIELWGEVIHILSRPSYGSVIHSPLAKLSLNLPIDVVVESLRIVKRPQLNLIVTSLRFKL